MEFGVQTVPPPSDAVPKRKNPWGPPPTAALPCSLAAVMDEELAKKMQSEEEQRAYRYQLPGHPTPPPPTSADDPTTTSDLLLAQMMQLEFDREHDLLLRAEERQFNRDSKVRVSFENFRSLPPSQLQDEGEGDSQEEGEGEGEVPVPGPSFSRGRRRSKGVPFGATTKHDPILCGRKNVRNMEKFPVEFASGDLGDEQQDYRLPNSVFNTLRQHSYKEQKQAQRLHEKKEHSTQEHVFDPRTRLLLFKLVDAGVLTEVNGCVSTGKEASIYHAGGGSMEDQPIPSECALKVFKTTLNEFRSRDRYIKDDYRFKDRFSKMNPRKVVRLWAEKELHNLKRLHEAGIPCPEVVLLKKHILIMSFIGRDHKPAPKLKEVRLSREQLQSAYQQCIQAMQRMFSECRLIHADLSEYNMLWHEGRVYFIDVSQSVEPSHPHALEFLLRDCTNVSSFFSRAGLSDVMTPHQLFNFVSALDIEASNDQEFLAQIHTHTKRQRLADTMHSTTQPYPFDYYFEESRKTSGVHPQQSSSSDSETECGGE